MQTIDPYIYPETDLNFVAENIEMRQMILSSRRKNMNMLQCHLFAFIYQQSGAWKGARDKKALPFAREELFKKVGLPPSMDSKLWESDIIWLYLSRYLGGKDYDPKLSINNWIKYGPEINDGFTNKLSRLGSLEKIIAATAHSSRYLNKSMVTAPLCEGLMEHTYDASAENISVDTLFSQHVYYEIITATAAFLSIAPLVLNANYPFLPVRIILYSMDVFDIFSNEFVRFSSYSFLNLKPEYRITDDGKLDFYLQGKLVGKETALVPYKLNASFPTAPSITLGEILFPKITARIKQILPLPKTAARTISKNSQPVFLPAGYQSKNFNATPIDTNKEGRAIVLQEPIIHPAGHTLFEKGDAFYLHYKVKGDRIIRSSPKEARDLMELDIDSIKDKILVRNKDNEDAEIAGVLIQKELEMITKVTPTSKHLKNSIHKVIDMIRKQVEIQDTYTVRHSQGVARYYSNILTVASRLSDDPLNEEERDFMIREKIDYPLIPGKLVSDENLNWAWLAAYTHDIGKKDIHSFVLKKNTSLSEAEYHEIKQHVLYSARLLSKQGLEFLLFLNAYHHVAVNKLFGYPDIIETSNGLIHLVGEKAQNHSTGLATHAMAVADFLHTREGRPYTGDRASPLAYLAAEVKRCSGLVMTESDWAAILEERMFELKARSVEVPHRDYHFHLEAMINRYRETGFKVSQENRHSDLVRLLSLIDFLPMKEVIVTGRDQCTSFGAYLKKIVGSWFTRPLLYDPRVARIYVLHQPLIHSKLIRNSDIFGLPGGQHLLVPEKSPFAKQ